MGYLKGLTALPLSCADGTRPRYIIYPPAAELSLWPEKWSAPAPDVCSCFGISSLLYQPEQQRCSIKAGDKMPVDFKAQAPSS